jgi:hypothetical protein
VPPAQEDSPGFPGRCSTGVLERCACVCVLGEALVAAHEWNGRPVRFGLQGAASLPGSPNLYTAAHDPQTTMHM